MSDAARIDRPASQPDADLACEFDIARGLAEEGFRERLSQAIAAPVRDLPDGVEVTFRADAWDLVLRYVEVESQCCPFLDLSARRGGESVVLRVTGRPEAGELIRNIFTARGDDCC